MPCVPMWLSIVGGVLFALAGATGSAGQAPGATTLTLTADAGASTVVHQVVHLSAALDASGLCGSGAVTFFDGANAIATVPLTQPVTVLGVATLSLGSHALTAAYSGDGANIPSSSAAVSVSVTALPASFALSAGANTVYANQSVTLSTVGLPKDATGVVAFAESSGVLASVPISGLSGAYYQAFGDAITSGGSLADPSFAYASVFAADKGFGLSTVAAPGSIACDLMPYQILGNALGPTETNAPLSSVMVGTNDVVFRSSVAYEPVFRACHQATLAWLAIPREYKILAADAAVRILSGVWMSSPRAFDLNTFGTLFNRSGTGSVQYAVTSAGTPIYLWYLISDQLSGSFTVSVDGTPTGVTYLTQSSPSISSMIASNASMGYGLARITAPPGPHVLEVDIQSGSVGILAVGTPPSAGGASNHPTVLVTDVPNELTTNPAASPALAAEYTRDVQDDATVLQGDGLDLRFVPTQQLMLGTPGEMYDQVTPNALGHAHIATALEDVFGSTPVAAYTRFTNSPPAGHLIFSNPGTHVLTGTYSGDGTYGAANATFTLTVLPQQTTSTTLSTSSTHFPAGAQAMFTVGVAPLSATGTISFFEGTQLLGQVPLVSGSALFTTSSLAVGVHTISATYSGDEARLSSTSPVLALEIDATPTTLTLTPLPPTTTYGASTSIVATIGPSTATGNITFTDSLLAPGQTQPQVTTLGQAGLATGSATLSATLGVGVHTIRASYAGDPATLSSISNAVTCMVQAVASSITLAPLPTTVPYGSNVSFRSSVFPSDASGSVTVHDVVSGTVAQSVLVNGAASSSTDSLTLGVHSLNVVYSGDLLHAGSASVTATLQVVAAASAVTLSNLPATLLNGASMQLIAQVTPASAGGTVVFRDGNAGVLGEATVVRGTATLQLTSLSAGSYAITASYSGDQFNGPSTSTTITTQVVLPGTSTSLVSLPSSAVYSATVPLTAAVASSVPGITPGGLVRFLDGSRVLASALLLNGVATAQVGTLTVGAHSIQAIYVGDDGDAPSASSAGSMTVAPAATSVSLGLAQTNVSASGVVTFNVRVGTAVLSLPGGLVRIRSASTVLASGSLIRGANNAAYATLSVDASTLGVGAFSVVASYLGDGNDLPSESGVIYFTVVPVATVTSLTLSSTQAAAGTSVMLTSSVASFPSGAPATGSVVFSSNGKAIATVPLDPGGHASTTLVPSAPGLYAISANLSPTGPFAASSSPLESITVMLPFSIAVNPLKLDAIANSSGTATLTIAPLFNFNGALQPQCISPAPYVACAVDPATSVAGITTRTTVHISVAPNTVRAASAFPLLSLLLLPLAFCRRLRRPLIVVVIGVAAAATGCATGGDFFAVPAGAVPLAITVNAAGVTATTTLTVNVTR